LEYLRPFLITALTLALTGFASLGGSTPLVSVEARNATLQSPTVRIEPTESSVDVSETFTITVMIDEADEVGGFQFDMLFITTTVTVDSVTLGDFLGSTGRTVGSVGPIIDNQAGRVSFGAWSLPGAPGPNGTGALALVTLTAQDSGESPLDLLDVLVLDTHAEHETPTVEDGSVVVDAVPTATSTPTTTSTPTSTATATATSTPSPSHKIYLPLLLKGW